MSRPIIDIATKRSIYNVLILSLVFPIGAMWLFWKGNMDEVSWFLFIEYSLPLQWFHKDMWTEVAQIIPAIVIYRKSRNSKLERIMAIVYLVYLAVDLLLFFLCYNTWDYAIVYSFLIPVGAVVGLVKYLKIPVGEIVKESVRVWIGKLNRGQSVQASVARKA